ncbi:secondary wall-associated glycosyltransferase family 43B [Tripterygium wilfordii]|uniref:Glycosyltransferases n=1 Tax=Tripterygium wilfordii TaxID=458696 RepID=A0A7J7CUI9_TRIWF|nr:secondary wall-associated glycosyltransferase family 43B [Tripterygium wilfordii]
MGSMERSKKKVLLWKKAIVHFSLCFVMGFFTGFAPTSQSSVFSNQAIQSNKTAQYSPQTVKALNQAAMPNPTFFDRSLIDKTPSMTEEQEENKLSPRRLIIIVTPLSTRDRFGGVFLRKLACSIRLVPLPLLWIVVEKQSGSDEASEILRKTGIMYRHLVFKENFTDPEADLIIRGTLLLSKLSSIG